MHYTLEFLQFIRSLVRLDRRNIHEEWNTKSLCWCHSRWSGLYICYHVLWWSSQYKSNSNVVFICTSVSESINIAWFSQYFIYHLCFNVIKFYISIKIFVESIYQSSLEYVIIELFEVKNIQDKLEVLEINWKNNKIVFDKWIQNALAQVLFNKLNLILLRYRWFEIIDTWWLLTKHHINPFNFALNQLKS